MALPGYAGYLLVPVSPQQGSVTQTHAALLPFGGRNNLYASDPLLVVISAVLQVWGLLILLKAKEVELEHPQLLSIILLQLASHYMLGLIQVGWF